MSFGKAFTFTFYCYLRIANLTFEDSGRKRNDQFTEKCTRQLLDSVDRSNCNDSVCLLRPVHIAKTKPRRAAIVAIADKMFGYPPPPTKYG